MDLFDCHSDSFECPASADPAFFLNGTQVSDRAGQIIDRIEQFGVRVSPASRLRKYQKLLSKDTSSGLAEEMAQNVALLECLQFHTIVRMLEGTDPPHVLRAKMKSAVGGAPFATDDSSGSKARSDQAELYVAAVLVAGGFSVEFAEPDILVEVGDDARMAVAVKRPRSKSRAIRNIRAGANQIRKSGLPGIIAMDVSFVKEPGKPIYVREPNAHQVLAKILLDGHAKEYQSDFIEIVKRPGIMGLLLHFSCVVRSLEPHMMMVSRRWLMMAEKQDPVIDEVARAIQELGAIPPSDLDDRGR